MSKVLMKGNEAIAEAALRADVDAFFGYPITPQNEIPEYLARELPKKGKLFLQSESELSAMNMVMGASAAGKRVLTSSSGPGLCLKQEAISSMALTRLPAVVVNVVRSGPGMGDLAPAQEDYWQAGNGSYRIPKLLPASVQEAVEMTYEAFDIADQYRIPVLVLADGMIGQMMEGVDFNKLPQRRENLPEKDWRMVGTNEKGHWNHMTLHPNMTLLKATSILENEIYPEIEKNECKVEIVDVKDADIVLVAYGSASRMSKSVMIDMEGSEIKLGLIRPKTAWPYPYDAFNEIGPNCKAVIVPEMNIIGQMIDDVRIGAKGRWPVYHVGNDSKSTLNPEYIMNKINEVWEEVK
jgi:2-oxoglutarate ferredoxin oxidoreductase subunit alpha